MMKYVLDKMFELAGSRADNYLTFKKLDPMYRLGFKNKEIKMVSDHKKMAKEIERLFPGNAKGFYRYIKNEAMKFKHLAPCLERPYLSFFDLIDDPFLKAMPYLELHRTVYQSLSRYFNDELLKLCFTFQSKYLGMSAWECPAAFSMIAYVEHEFGIYHVTGGLNRISEAMARVAEEKGAKIHLKTKVEKITNSGKKVTGIVLSDGTKIEADYVIVNADFSHAVLNLMDPQFTKKYSPARLSKKKYSCSTFMLYLCVDKVYDIPHHNIFFAEKYRENVDDIFKNLKLSDEISFYIQNPSLIDETLAPKGCSTIYVLEPVPNLRAGIDWKKEKIPFREKVIKAIETRTELNDIREHIISEAIITPEDWQNDYNVYIGATFDLGHNIPQMLYFRPPNKFECFDNMYLVGGGTHPGSGLPTIYESGKITANLITEAENDKL
ncbi:MAG: phytoene desaturase family protein [Thermoplasmata archaeon]